MISFSRQLVQLLTAAVFFIGGVGLLSAATFTGAVISVSADIAKVAMNGDVMPPNGARAEIFFKVPGGEEEISVATGSALKIDQGDMLVKIESASGTVEKGQLVRFSSSPSGTPPASSPIPTASPKGATSPASSPPPTDENPQIVIDKNDEFPPFDLSDFLGVSFALEKDGSVIVSDVKANSVGAQMGLTRGDRIVEINDKPVPMRETAPRAITQEELGKLVGASPNSALQIIIERGADKERMTISLPPAKPPLR